MGKEEKNKRRRMPFWLQITIILFCGAVVAGGTFATIYSTRVERNATRYTVTFAYQNGEIIETASVKEGEGVIPPAVEIPGVFQGWSRALNNITADIEAHPNYYSITDADENLFCFDSVYVEEGDSFTIKVLLTGKVNISSAEIAILYDPEVMGFIGSDDNELCKVEEKNDGELALTLKSETPITETMVLSEIEFEAFEKDIYSSQIELSYRDAKLVQSGVESPATVSTLNNNIYYLQEV